MSEEKKVSPAETWLQLIRLPNQFTVPGDVLAGAALIGALSSPDWTKISVLVLISICLYSAGLLFNDWFDRKIDAVERPFRPIPSGSAKASQVFAAGTFLILLAVGLSSILSPISMIISAVIAFLVIIYNSFAKNIPFLGLAVMAGCRFFNIVLGGSLGDLQAREGFLVFFAAGIAFSYIFIVAWIAVKEMEKLPSKFSLLLLMASPFLVLLSGTEELSKPGCLGIWLAFGLLIINTWSISMKLWKNEEIKKTGKYVGALIRNLIIIQAFWVAVGTNPSCLWVVSVLLLWPIGSWAGRKFYGS